jgi:hypothetical protein
VNSGDYSFVESSMQPLERSPPTSPSRLEDHGKVQFAPLYGRFSSSSSPPYVVFAVFGWVNFL